MSEPTKEIKLQFLKQEIAGHQQAIYILSIRHRVNKKLGQTEEQLKPLADDIVKSEQAIDELEKIIKELEKDATP